MFDAQVVLSPTTSPLGMILSNFVRVRITEMDAVDIGLFDRDWNNSIYYFMLNADERIYLRYGGRDSLSPDTYLSLASLEVAARQALDLHRRYENRDLQLPDRPAPFFPRQIPLLVERTYARGDCVECHLIGDFQNIQRERDGMLDKLTHLYRSPDIKTLGIELDVPKGLVVGHVRGAVQEAGMTTGDRISSLNGTRVWTFGDLQYAYDKVDRQAKQVEITVDREAASHVLTVTLPPRWWWTDLRFRQSSVDPQLDFEDAALTDAEKQQYGLRPRGFASRITRVADRVAVRKTHSLRAGDVVYGVDGAEEDELADTASLYVKLRRKAGQSAVLEVIREGRRLQTPLTTYALRFRK